MNKKFLIPVIAVIIIVIIGGALMNPFPQKPHPNTLSISYTDTNKELQLLLATYDIAMSSPLRLNGFSIDEYCTFFSDESVQNAIEYCTSTELLDSDGNYLGNIHMVGLPDSPHYVIGVIQANPLVSQLDDIKIVYQTMIETLVCDCWQDQKPGDIESISAWVEAANNHHLEAKKITSKSEVKGLAQKDLLLEITTNTEGYLWKFIISN